VVQKWVRPIKTASLLKSEYGTAFGPFAKCRPRANGWMMLLAQGQAHTMSWQGHDFHTNISYTGQH